MGDYYFNKIGSRSNQTAVGTNAGVSATLAASAGYKWTLTGIQCSGDAAAVVTVESPAATVLYQKRFAAAFTLSETFPLGFIEGADSAALLVKVSASTTHSEANIQGAKISST